MGLVYRILNHPRAVPACDERRVWLEAGEWITLGPRLRITYYVDRQVFRSRFYSRVAVVTGDQIVEMLPLRHDWMDMRAWAALHVIPVAIEYGDDDRPQRIRLQFVRTSRALQWAS